MKCKNCGTENVEATFCANCGAKLEPEEVSVEENNATLFNEQEEIDVSSDNASLIEEPMSQENITNEEISFSNDVKENKVDDETILQPEISKLEKENTATDFDKPEDKQKRKKKFPIVIIAILILAFLLASYLLYEYLCPRLSVTNMKENYQLEDFLKVEHKIKSSLFIKDKDTVWNLNGYDFYKGKSPSSIPVKSGENKLIVTSGKTSKTYTFTISTGEALLITDEDFIIEAKDLDYDGDGIPNGKEIELGLSTYTNDTDGDGLYDNVELIMGLDPKTKDDYNKIRSYDVVQDNKKEYQNYVTIKGKGNIANNFLDTIEFNLGYSTKFIVSDTVTLVTSEAEKPEEKTIYFKKKYNWKLDSYSIYDYNKKTSELKELDTKENDKYLYANIEFDHILFVGKKEEAPTGEYKNQIMLLIDNSGSMYPKDYVEEKTGKTSSSKSENYNNDVEFKRLSLMNSLIDRLGTEKYTYSVHAFTGDYCNLITQSQEKEVIKEKINSLKTDCQNFNGTELSGSIRKYADTFDFETPGVKYMIVLTDGIDAGFFTYELYDFELSSYKKKGIKIITIGLGNGVNSEYLQKIAAKTDGAYLYASDANMLETLISIIENSITNQKVDKIDDKEVTLIADSGFEVTRDGFSFKNFSSQDASGNCYGFSSLSKLIFLNKLPMSAEKSGSGKSELIEYTLTDTNKVRLKKGNVYKMELNSGYQFYLNMKDIPDDYRYLGEDGIPYLNKKYKDELISLGYVPIIKENAAELTIAGKKDTYQKYESSGSINLFKEDIDEKYKDDYQVLQLINRNYRIQLNHTLDRVKDNISKMAQGKTYDYEIEVKQIIAELKTGSPALLSLNAEVGGHSVLATKVYKSNDLEEYIVGIYDSNAPGKEGRSYLKRQTMYYPFSETTYYNFSYNGAGIDFKKMIYAGEY